MRKPTDFKKGFHRNQLLFMKNWSFKIKDNPISIMESLKSSLKPINDFSFNIESENKSVINFKMRKRIMYAWYLIYQNNLIVDGKLLNNGSSNETEVQVSFQQHILWKIIIGMDILLGIGLLAVLFSGKIQGISVYLLGIGVFVAEVFLLIHLRKKYERNIQEYKNLISDILIK